MYKMATLDLMTDLGDTGTGILAYGVMGKYDRPIDFTWMLTDIGWSSPWR